jgi:Uma2 family endonuclease
MAVILEKEPVILLKGIQSEEILVKQLLQSPRLVGYFEEIKQTLEEERKKRQQFYDMITEEQKAEFINGEIVMHSPAKLKHNLASSRLFTLLRTYVTLKNLGIVGHEKIMISLTRNDYEPDICFFGREKADLLDLDQWQFPAPDFIVEILSQSTEKRDRDDKFFDYAAHGVAEYWIIDPTEEFVEQYQLGGSAYKLLRKLDAGILKSIAIPGFEIPVRALFDEDEQKRALQNIMTSAQ